MTLIDAGPLVALVNKKDNRHADCLATMATLPHGPLLTTWPCFTEAMYLLFGSSRYPGQESLWQFRSSGRLLLHDATAAEVDRMAELMDKYQNVPMDLADASLIAAAEQRGLRLIFTLDRDFYIYRLADGSALQVVP